MDCLSFSYFSLFPLTRKKKHEKTSKIGVKSSQKKLQSDQASHLGSILATLGRNLLPTWFQLGPFCSILLLSFAENSNQIVHQTSKSPQDLSRPRFSLIFDRSRPHFLRFWHPLDPNAEQPNNQTTERKNSRTAEQPTNRTAEQPNRRTKEQPNSRTTDQPNRRTAEPPNRRTAEPPNRRTAEQPCRRTAEQPNNRNPCTSTVADVAKHLDIYTV